MKTVGVKFEDSWGGASKTYHYMCRDEAVQVDDYVVVDTPSSGYQMVKVVEVKDGALPQATKEIVTRVDDTAYKASKEQEAERKRIVGELTKIHKKRQEEAQFEYLAAVDPAAKELLERLKTLQS